MAISHSAHHGHTGPEGKPHGASAGNIEKRQQGA
jgi:hypothetical protein